jgi:hypothetical protein
LYVPAWHGNTTSMHLPELNGVTSSGLSTVPHQVRSGMFFLICGLGHGTPAQTVLVASQCVPVSTRDQASPVMFGGLVGSQASIGAGLLNVASIGRRASATMAGLGGGAGSLPDDEHAAIVTMNGVAKLRRGVRAGKS